MLILIWSLIIEQIKVQGMLQHFISLMHCRERLVLLNLILLGCGYFIYIICEKLALPLVGLCFRVLTSEHGNKWQVHDKLAHGCPVG